MKGIVGAVSTANGGAYGSRLKPLLQGLLAFKFDGIWKSPEARTDRLFSSQLDYLKGARSGLLHRFELFEQPTHDVGVLSGYVVQLTDVLVQVV